MTLQQEKFLRLAVIDKIKYFEIAKQLDVDLKTLSKWWDELKEPRERLSRQLQIWKSKCKDTDFKIFQKWLEGAPKKCFYCDITEAEIEKLYTIDKPLTKRSRGKKLEIDRKEPSRNYEDLSNLVFACYWCNNAKTDTFSVEEFKPIGREIKRIWKGRLSAVKNNIN